VQTQPIISTSGTAPDSSLVAWYPLDNELTNAYDFSGNGHNGTIVGATQGVDGIFGNAYELNGSNTDYINVGTNSDFDLTSVGTLSAWINATSPRDYPVIMGKLEGSTDATFVICSNN